MLIDAHPGRDQQQRRLMAIGRTEDSGFAGEIYRFIDPRFSNSASIVRGDGARHAHGRWHGKGLIRITYASLSPRTALEEALASVAYFRLAVSHALPRVLVALRLQCTRVLDLRNGAIRSRLHLSDNTIRTTDWRAENQGGREAITQAWGLAFATAGFEAVIVPSAADRHGSNVLVFPANLAPGSRFEVVNDVSWPAR